MRKTALVLAIVLCMALALPAYASAPLRDVDMSTAQGRAIEQMVSKGYIQGFADGTFRPNEPISALAYITMISKARDIDSPSGGYMHAALEVGWYDWDQIPPNQAGSEDKPIARELGANILVKAFFGAVDYDWSITKTISDFDQISGRYYVGVLGGMTLGILDHTPGTAFDPLSNLTRGEACLWTANAITKASEDPSASSSPSQSSAPSESSAPSASTAPDTPDAPDVEPVNGGVSQNGWLQVKGTQLCNESGQPVLLHGMSSMGIQWYPQFTNYQSLLNTKSRGANIFRIAMYTEEGGYFTDPAKFTALVEQIVENAVRADMYVIIDWHILSDGNPMEHIDAAAAFFDKMSAKYAHVPNVLYEICNEPNGNITWAQNVKPYAERMVRVIRANSPRGIILIGNPMWDQDVDIAAADPVAGDNLMYTLHFYAGTHHQALRDKASRALEMGAPIFVSEWGTSDASGSGGVFIDSSNEWMQFMDEHKLSWCNWSLCNNGQTSAALTASASPDTTWTSSDLSESGNYVFDHFGKTQDVPRPTPIPAPSQTPYPTVIEPVTAQQAARQFSDIGTVRITKNGTILTENEPVSTGCDIELLSPDGTLLKSAKIVVKGDLTGSGTVGLTDLVLMAGAMRGTASLSGLALQAAELNNEQGVDLADLVREADIFIHGGALECTFVDEETA